MKMRVAAYVYEKDKEFDGSFENGIGKQVALISRKTKEDRIEAINEKFNAAEHVYSFKDLK
jgi:hypothetical protein